MPRRDFDEHFALGDVEAPIGCKFRVCVLVHVQHRAIGQCDAALFISACDDLVSHDDLLRLRLWLSRPGHQSTGEFRMWSCVADQRSVQRRQIPPRQWITLGALGHIGLAVDPDDVVARVDF